MAAGSGCFPDRRLFSERAARHAGSPARRRRYTSRMGIVDHPVALLGAPSSIGIRPYESGEARHLDRAPAALRSRGLAKRLNAADLGDVLPPPYLDFTRPGVRPRNEAGVESYSRALGERVAASTTAGNFTLVLGGDCSIVLGGLLGVRQATGGLTGLAYVDGHADFAAPEESLSGSAASMCLSLAVGRGDTPLARLLTNGPLTEARHVALLGRHDEHDEGYGNESVLASPMLDLRATDIRSQGGALVAAAALDRLAAEELAGFWIHLDADVIDAGVLPAVDSPEPGLQPDAVAELLRPMVRHPAALGMEVTIYDPGLDPDGTSAETLALLLESILTEGKPR